MTCGRSLPNRASPVGYDLNMRHSYHPCDCESSEMQQPPTHPQISDTRSARSRFAASSGLQGRGLAPQHVVFNQRGRGNRGCLSVCVTVGLFVAPVCPSDSRKQTDRRASCLTSEREVFFFFNTLARCRLSLRLENVTGSRPEPSPDVAPTPPIVFALPSLII